MAPCITNARIAVKNGVVEPGAGQAEAPSSSIEIVTCIAECMCP
jgi:hypothetical protein